MGNHHQAILDFQKAIEIDKNNTMAFFFSGISRLQSKQIDEAIKDF